MTIPKWLLPVLAVIAALAVAAAAVLIGTHFASPDIQLSPSKKAEVPVIAPLDNPSDKKGRSEIIGHTLVTLPGTNNPTLQQQLIDDVAGSTDPHGAIIHHGGGGSGAPAADPCAPATGPVPAGCPAGSTGRIRPDLAPMWVNALAFAPAHSATPEDPRCPAAASAAGEVPIGVSAPAPSHYELQYWPTGHPSTRTIATADTDAADRTAYQTAANDATIATADLPIQHSCIVLHVDPTLTYTGQVIATDDNGRGSDPTPVSFNGNAGDVHPELEVGMLGDNIIHASAVARDDQRVEFYVVFASVSAAASTCAQRGLQTTTVNGLTVTLSAADVSAHHWPERFTQRYSKWMTVPFGRAFLVCARWFSGTTPSTDDPWNPSSPVLYESRQIVSTPDILMPTLTTTGFSGGVGVSQVTVSTDSGVVCRGASGPSLSLSSADVAPVPYDLCSASFDSTAHPFYIGDVHYLAVSVDQSDASGHFRNLAGIAAPLLPCSGACTIPAPRTYRVSLDPSSNDHGWWDFQLSYSPTPGGDRLATSEFGGVSSTDGTAGAVTSPTLDTAATVGTTGMSIEPYFSISATVPVSVNEPVDYSIRIFPSATSGPLQCPTSPVPHAEGHLDHSGVVTIPGLCLASTYHARVILIDAAGHTRMWDSIGSDPSGIWPGATFSTPGLHSTLHWDLTATGLENGYVSDVDVSLRGLYNSVELGTADPSNGQCLADGHLHASGTADGSQIGPIIRVYVQYRIRSTAPGGAPCAPVGTEPMVTTASGTYLTLDDMVHATPAVTITDPAGRYTLTLSLVPTP
ncbi:MAG: hypothetical protein ABIS08_09285 [Pseudolysinimonas sp.]